MQAAPPTLPISHRPLPLSFFLSYVTHRLLLQPTQSPHKKQMAAAKDLLAILKERGGDGDGEEAAGLEAGYGL